MSLPDAAPPPPPLALLTRLGWQKFFADQSDSASLKRTPPVRVVAQHRSGFTVMGEGLDMTLPPIADVTVGDWLLLNRDLPGNSQRLERRSLFKRRAPGKGASEQLIAANIDTVFIVTSCNAEFNPARLERYLALAAQADVPAVILLTKADLCDAPEEWRIRAEQAAPDTPVLILNAKDESAREQLQPWCEPGQTVAFLGSSGVGKSTLVNALAGHDAARTGGIREADGRGRHTTTHRALFVLPQGPAVLDTPGMREVQLSSAAQGISDVFSDIADLAATCKFNDCAHQSEPGCAVQGALRDGTLDPARLERWRKLTEEEALNTASLSLRKGRARPAARPRNPPHTRRG